MVGAKQFSLPSQDVADGLFLFITFLFFSSLIQYVQNTSHLRPFLQPDALPNHLIIPHSIILTSLILIMPHATPLLSFPSQSKSSPATSHSNTH